MRLTYLPLLSASLLAGCVMDRTGQSASEQYKRELTKQGTRVANLEGQFDRMDDRVSQQEELTMARGQEEIMRMESLDQVRQEVARIRGDFEVLAHENDQRSADSVARDEDYSFRVQWLESRADQLEKSLGVKTPPAPKPVALTTAALVDTTNPDGTTTAPPEAVDNSVPEGVTEPAALMKLAEDHLAAGREKAAEAVLNRFLELHPKDERAPEAYYRRAEAAFNSGDFPSAVLRFQMVIDNYKTSSWAPWAMLRQGECFESQGQKDNAKLFYEDVVRLWPKSKAAKEAKDKMGK
jgi:tol-pal system protein YbgF